MAAGNPQKPASRPSPSPITGAAESQLRTCAFPWLTRWPGSVGRTVQSNDHLGINRPRPEGAVWPIAMVPDTVRILIGYAAQIDAAIKITKTASCGDSSPQTNGGAANMISRKCFRTVTTTSTRVDLRRRSAPCRSSPQRRRCRAS